MSNIFGGSTEYKSMAQQAKTDGYQGEQIDIGLTGYIGLGAQATFTRATTAGRNKISREEYAKRDKLIADSGLAREYGLSGDLTNFTRGLLTIAPVGKGLVSREYKRKVEEKRENIARLAADHPELGIKTDEEIENDIIERHKDNLREEVKAQDNASTVDKAAFFVGNILGFVKDPINAMAIATPYSLARGSVSQALTKVFGAEAAITAGLSASQKKGELELRKDLGEDVKSSQLITEPIIEGAIGGLFGATIGAIGIGLSKAITGRLNKRTEKIVKEVMQEIDVEVNAASTSASQLAARDKQAIIEEGVEILRRQPEEIPTDVHLKAYQKAAQDVKDGKIAQVDELVEQYLPPEYRGAQTKIDEASDTSPEAPEGSRLEDADLDNDVVRERIIDNTRAGLEKNDIQFTTKDFEGNDVSKSAKVMLDEMKADRVAIKDVITCMTKGAANGA